MKCKEFVTRTKLRNFHSPKFFLKSILMYLWTMFLFDTLSSIAVITQGDRGERTPSLPPNLKTLYFHFLIFLSRISVKNSYSK